MRNVILTIVAIVAFSGAAIADDHVGVSNDFNVSTNNDTINSSSASVGGLAIAIGGECVTYMGNVHSNDNFPADFRGRIDAIGIPIDGIETVCYDGDGNFEFNLKNGSLIRSEEAVNRTNSLPRSEWFCKKL